MPSRRASQILKLPGAGKVELLGVQDEVIHLNFSTQHVAGLGVDQQAVLTSLQQQNVVAPSGIVQAGPETVSLRVSGRFTSEESLRAVNIRVQDRFFRLTDVATITRGYVDPPQPLFRFNGQPAIGIAIGMKANSNIIEFGKNLRAHMSGVVADLPIGVGVHLVSNQPAVVEEAIGGFTRALFEAVAIVLVVSFLSLGLRAGLVVAIAIPLVLAATFVFMEYSGIILQRISLGALIIALGLLVDDAMISVEMMVARREAGDSLERSATFAYSSTAFPMLTGTLVTVAGFVPIGLNGSSAGEYTFTLFAVIAAALLISWVGRRAVHAAARASPCCRVRRSETRRARRGSRRGSHRCCCSPCAGAGSPSRVTLALFALSCVGLGFVQEQFFPCRRPARAAGRHDPAADRARSPRPGAKWTGWKRRWSAIPTSCAGVPMSASGAVRFYLPLDEQLANPVLRPGRDRHQGFRRPPTGRGAPQEAPARGLRRHRRLRPSARPRAAGRPADPVPAERAGHPDGARARPEIRRGLSSNASVGGIVYDWNEPGMVLRIDVDQNRARQLGVSSQDIATMLNNVVGGSTVTQMYDSIYLINIVARADRAERVVDRDLPDPAARRPRRPADAAARHRHGAVPDRAADRVAAQPPADHHPAGRRDRRPAARHRGPASSSPPSTSSRPSCRPTTRSPSAARSKRAPRASGRSPTWCR